MQKERISILGCGWFGLPLAQKLIGEGYRVKGSTTREEKLGDLKAAGIEPYRIVVGETVEGDLKGLLDTDILIVDIPPGRREDIEEFHVMQLSQLIDALLDSPVKHVLFISSTSVYPDLGKEVVETDDLDPDIAGKPAGRALLFAEEMLRSERAFGTTVVRFGGLIGPGRNPSDFLQRMKVVADPDQPVNLIHLDDCIGVVSEIIRQGAWGEVFNACCPEHPTRRSFYQAATERLGVVAPIPEDSGAASRPFKIVSSRKLIESLGYRFQHPDPLAFAR
ncbi:MAG: SDR family oxidoreductase [Chlorobiaceae bacterium]|nr:SDR family oxidoreductase [Chlorobiaceae bacterium]